MSKETYIRGFCKAAADRGVDPSVLAAMTKQALSLDDVKKWLSDAYGSARSAWHSVPDKYKPLVGGVVGGAAGAGLGAAGGSLTGIGAGKGALAGLGIGGIGGSLFGARSAYLKSVADALNSKKRHEAAYKRLQDYSNQRQGELEKRIQAAEEEGRHNVAATEARMTAERQKSIADLKNKIDEADKAIKSLKDKNEALRLSGAIAKGMPRASYERLSPQQRQAAIRELEQERDRISAALASANEQELIMSIKGFKVQPDPDAQKWYEQRQKDRRDSANRKQKRQEEKRVAEQEAMKRREPISIK